MELTELEAAALRGHYMAGSRCTPEQLAEQLGATLGEVREAEKTALRKIDPATYRASGAADAELSELEAAVLRECLPATAPASPEDIAAATRVTVGEVIDAIKSGMRKLEDPAHASNESLHALGLRR